MLCDKLDKQYFAKTTYCSVKNQYLRAKDLQIKE